MKNNLHENLDDQEGLALPQKYENTDQEGMESTFDIEATRIPESKQEQRIDMQHDLHNIIRTEN